VRSIWSCTWRIWTSRRPWPGSSDVSSCRHPRHPLGQRPALCGCLYPTPASGQRSSVTWYDSAPFRKNCWRLSCNPKLYADTRRNAVFLLRGEDHQPVGAELRGTGPARWRGLAPGSRCDLGCFRVQPASPTSIVLCESAIDALSCSLLHSSYCAISTSGARADPPWLARLLQQGLPIYCGFDADPAGDQQAQLMMALHPQVRRLRPSHHDWNDVLQACRSSIHPSTSLPSVAKP